MTSGQLGDVGLAYGVFELALHGRLMQVMAGDASGLRMRAKGRRGEEVLPGPFAGCIRPFAQQGFWHVDVTGPDG